MPFTTEAVHTLDILQGLQDLLKLYVKCSAGASIDVGEICAQIKGNRGEGMDLRI